MSLEQSIIDTLRAEVIPAMGCTEPVAVALAVSKARELSGLCTTDLDDVVTIEVSVSPNIFKNGLSVGIPGTKEVGLIMAIALGYSACYSRDGLEVFESVHEKELELAKVLIENNKVILKMEDTSDKIFIHAKITTKDGFSRAIIKDRHDQFILMEDQHGVVFEQTVEKVSTPKVNPLYSEPLVKLIEAVEKMPHDPLVFLLDGLVMNQHIANYGLMNKCGMGVGYTLNEQADKGLLGKDLMNRAMAMTAAASDARMSGVSLPVMSSNGSGNNGLTALLPIVAYAEKNNISDEKLAKAAAMSHLINGTIKNAIGRLSAICGCGVAAGTGASVAIAWLMGANISQIEGVIQNMIANTAGMVCDGAKEGCSLKLATSASAAVQSAILAVNDVIVTPGSGIVGNSADETIRNLGILSSEALMNVDQVIIKIMTSYTN